MYSRTRVWTSIFFAFLAGVFAAEFVAQRGEARSEQLPAWMIQREVAEPEATLAQLRSDASPRWPQN